MSALSARIAMPILRTPVRGAAVVAVGLGVLALAACGGGALEVQPVEEDERDAVLADLPPETDPAALADAHAVLQKVPNAAATPLDGGILFGGTGGSSDESFGFPSGPSASSGGGIGFGSSVGRGGGSTFGSSNADATAGDGLSGAGEALGDAAAAAAAAGSRLVDSGPDTADGGSFGFRSDGGGSDGSFGVRSDGPGGAPAPPSGPGLASAVDGTPGAVVATPGVTLPGGGGNSFGYRVDQPRVQAPRSFGYAGPPRPEDRVPTGDTPGAPAPVAAPTVPVAGAVPVVVSGVPLDTLLPPASRTISPPAAASAPSAPVAAPRPATAASPAPVAARPRPWGCAPASRPGAPPRLRALRAPETSLQSVTFVCLPAGVLQRLAQPPRRHPHHTDRRRR